MTQYGASGVQMLMDEGAKRINAYYRELHTLMAEQEAAPMTTPEGKVKEKVKQMLMQFGVYWHCPVQNGMGAPSLDFICCVRGQYLAIETKAPGGHPTERQMRTMEEIEKSGGKVILIDGDAGLMELSAYLSKLCS